MEGLSRSQPKTWGALRLRMSLCLCVLESSVFCVFCVFWRGCSGPGLGALMFWRFACLAAHIPSPTKPPSHADMTGAQSLGVEYLEAD